MDAIQPNITGKKSHSSDRAIPLAADVALACSVVDAAKIAGLSRSSIYVLIGNGQLKSLRIAGRRLVPAAELRKLFQIA